MTLRTRRFIYSFFILIFAVTAPLLIFYARGYRLSGNQSALNLTGTMVISTTPRGAAIWLNGQKLTSTTPDTIQSVPASTYRLSLIKEGYRLWQKRFNLKSGGAIFVSNIRLWRDGLPTLISEGQFQVFSPDPTGQHIILVSRQDNKESFWLFDITTETTSLISERTVNNDWIDTIEWSPSGERFLAITTTNAYLIDLTKSPASLLSLNTLFSSPPKHWRWSIDNPKIIYISQENAAYSLTLNTAPPNKTNLNKIISFNKHTYIHDLWGDSETIHLITSTNGEKPILHDYISLTGQEISNFSLPLASEYRYRGSPDALLALQDENDLLTLWDRSNGALFSLIEVPRVKKIAFLPQTNELLYMTPLEIWTYNPTSDTKDLVIRFGDILTNATWHPSGDHAIFSTKDKIILTERDARDIRNQWNLTSVLNLADFTTTTNGETVYFAGTIGNKSGIWRLEL